MGILFAIDKSAHKSAEHDVHESPHFDAPMHSPLDNEGHYESLCRDLVEAEKLPEGVKPEDIRIDAPAEYHDGQRLTYTERQYAVAFFEARYRHHCEQIKE